MNSLGIYFGIKDINLVETNGSKIINNVRLPHPKLEISELEEKVPTDVKIIALLKDAFRSYRVNAGEVTFCISGQDLVIRTFEIPLLPLSEVRSGVSFEAKKYIPFKLEDLDYDYQLLFNKKNKTSLVLFVGIKKEILSNYLSFTKQLNLKINALEYSAFSVLRFLKLSGISDAGIIASICFDLNNEDETNFTVYENGFSLFSRDFDFAGEPAGFEQTAESDLLQKQDKLKKEIRISFEYYNRKFPEKAVKNIFVVADKDSASAPGLKTAFTEFAIPFKFIDTQKALGKTASYSSVLVKSFSAALFKSTPLKMKINLVGARLKAARAAASSSPFAFLEGVKLDLIYIFVGVVLCVSMFGWGVMRTQARQQELASIISQRVKITSVPASDNLDDLLSVSSKYKKKIRALDNVVKNQVYITPILSVIPRALPNGVWLDSFTLNQGKNGLELNLFGQVYLKDSEQEFESVNSFLANLKKDTVFSGYFKEILIGSIDRRNVDNKMLVVFRVTCRSTPEKK
jgi:Tfp pilus assembly protein PilN